MFAHSLIIIPTYNEALNVQLMIDKIFELFPEVSLLIIDDNSPDKTYSIVEMLKYKYPKLSLIKRKEKCGLGTAYIEGFRWALAKKFQHIIQMDCDFSHNPSDIKSLLETLKSTSADLVIGSRYFQNNSHSQNWSFHRKWLSIFASFVFRTFSSLKVRDLTGGFKCFNRSALERILSEEMLSKGFIFQFETNLKAHMLGLKIVETPISFTKRTHGHSKMSLSIIAESIMIFVKLKFT